MRTKALTLALLLFASALAGCFGEDAEDSIDTPDDIIVDDRSGNDTLSVAIMDELERAGANPDDCNSTGGTWIEASERGGESYCDIDAEDVLRVVCELANESWLQNIHHDDESSARGPPMMVDSNPMHEHSHSHGATTHTHVHEHGGYCDTDNQDVIDVLKIHCEFMGGNYEGHYCDIDAEDVLRVVCELANETWLQTIHHDDEPCERGVDNDCDPVNTHSHDHSHGSDSHTHSHSHRYFCDTDNQDVLDELKSNCEFMGGNWTSTNGTVERGDNSTNESWWECSLHDGDEEREEREITQEECEWRSGTWTQEYDEGDAGEFYCVFGDGDDEITREDCERRNGTWTEAPDRPDEFYCDFDTGGDESNNNTEPEQPVDSDRDGVADEDDAFPNDANETADTDGDGVGDNADACSGHDDSADADRDGTADGCDTCPNDADNDADRDGVCGDSDAFPNDANETADTDGDGVGDNADQCADTPSDATVGEDGCEEVEPQVHFIDISGMAFSPNTLTISVGDTVTWTNQDGAPHSATGDNGEFDSGTLNNGQNFSFTFTAAGTYTYHCSVHNGMTATIIVE